MTNMKERIMDEFKEAFKNKDSVKKNLLGEIKTAIVLHEKEKGEVSDEVIISMIEKAMKKVQATIDTCPVDRVDVLTQAENEKTILNSFIPPIFDEDDTKRLVLALLGDNPKKDELSLNKWLMIRSASELAQKLGFRVDKSILARIIGSGFTGVDNLDKEPFNKVKNWEVI